MKKLPKAGILVAAIVIAGFVVFRSTAGAPEKKAQAAAPAGAKKATADAPAKAAEPATPREKAWLAVKQWNEAGRKETESFSIASPEWRIDYTTLPAKGSLDPFQIGVYREDSGRMVALVVNVRGEVKDTAYVTSGPGRFFLKMTATAPWTVSVEDKR